MTTDALAYLIRRPFMVEIQTRAASRLAPAEYDEIEAPEDLVIEAFHDITERYLPEIEARVLELMERRKWDMEDAA